jgi:hypothetical protein
MNCDDCGLPVELCCCDIDRTREADDPTDDRPCGDCGAVYPEPHADDCQNA